MRRYIVLAIIALTIMATIPLISLSSITAHAAQRAASSNTTNRSELAQRGAPSASVSQVWYFAEGYTGPSFTEYLTIANPNTLAATVTVHYFLGSGNPITKTYLVAANSRYTILVNNEVGPNQNVSLIVTATLPVIAERPMYFTYLNRIPGGSDVLGSPELGTSFDFGYLDTRQGYFTYLTILNQNLSSITAKIQYFPANGGAPLPRTHQINASSRGTVSVGSEGLPPGSYSALVTLSAPGLVERPLYYVDSTGHTGSADVVGIATPQTDWYFAEGYTSRTFHESYILANPSTSVTANATVTFFRSNGTTATAQVTLLPGQQKTVDANGILTSNNVNNSAHVNANNPILAERFISFTYTGMVGGSSSASIPGASDVLGASAPGTLFYFAEGYTGSGFAEYLTIENPDPTNTASVTVTFLPANGSAPTVQVYAIAPSSRFTLLTNSILGDQSFSMVVASDVPIVAERPMYFIYAGNQTGGSDVIGYQPPTPTTYVGSADGFMYALNSATGALIWKFQTPGGSDSNATVANGMVYFGSSNGNFYALNTSTGALVWSFHIGASSYPASAVVNGVVYLAATNGMVYALNATDGSSIWSQPLAGFFQPIIAAPLVANGTVYVMVDGDNVTALSAGNGSLLWSDNDPSINASTPAVDNGLVYFIDGAGIVHALQAASGAEAWHSAALGGSSGNTDSVVSANGVVYAIDVLSLNIYAFNGTTGAVLWNTFAPAVADPFTSPAPTVANGILYTGDLDHNLYAYNASNGSLLWHYQTGNFVESTPSIANGIVYFGSSDTNIYALNAGTGVFVWSFQTGGTVTNTPTIAP